jgi:polar amino acid transport system substrate-binding protein
MGRVRPLLGLVVAALMPATLHATDAAIYELTTEELAPFSMPVGREVGGLSTDVLKIAFIRAGFTMEARLYPWLRAYQSALDKPNGCVYSAVRTPEREALFKWVGPIVHDDWVIFVPEESRLHPRSLSDLKSYKTASTPGDSLAAYLQENGIAVGYTPTDGQVQMLMTGRIDFWATTRARGAYFASRDKVKLRAALTLRNADMYLACNPRIPDAVIEGLNRAVRAMEQDGTMERLEGAYR